MPSGIFSLNILELSETSNRLRADGHREIVEVHGLEPGSCNTLKIPPKPDGATSNVVVDQASEISFGAPGVFLLGQLAAFTRPARDELVAFQCRHAAGPKQGYCAAAKLPLRSDQSR